MSEKIVETLDERGAENIFRGVVWLGDEKAITIAGRLYANGYRLVRVQPALKPGWYWVQWYESMSDITAREWTGDHWTLSANNPFKICRDNTRPISEGPPPPDQFEEWEQ